MSAFRYVTIWCDQSPSASLMACGEWVAGDTAAAARAEAKGNGWTTAVPDPGGGMPRDYCREHSAAL